jgi:hypothetical protein
MAFFFISFLEQRQSTGSTLEYITTPEACGNIKVDFVTMDAHQWIGSPCISSEMLANTEKLEAPILEL